MAKTMSVTRNQNHDDDASSKKRFRTFEKCGVVPWSDLTHDALFLVMMRLGVVDFVASSGVCKSWRSFAVSTRHKIKRGEVPSTADVLSLVMMRLGVFDFLSFSRVCKSWRSVALSNRKRFMASRPPTVMGVSNNSYRNEWYLKDFKGRTFRSILPKRGVMFHAGSTCGYLIFIGEETNEFWLVNPITRHTLHFPNFPYLENFKQTKAILVFSPSIHGGWVLVVMNRSKYKIWFSTASKGIWNHVLSGPPIYDLLAFKGKIYTIHKGLRLHNGFRLRLCELRLHPEPKLTILVETMNFPNPYSFTPEFVSSGEKLFVIDPKLFVIDPTAREWHNILELDFSKMEWVLLDEKKTGEYVFFLSSLKHGVAIKSELWAVYPQSKYNQYYNCFHYYTTHKTQKGRFFSWSGWYFPHLCLDVDILHE